MADSTRALSQWEIDNLLNQIPDAGGPGDVAAPEDFGLGSPRDRGLARVIKTYDFRRPDKFSKEQWQTLTAMHETFARMVGAQFSSRMRTLVTVRLSSIEQGLYEEWQSQVPTGTACYVLAMPPLAGSIVVEFNQDVAVDVIDRLLGGNAVMPVRGREMTDIELGLLRSFSTTLSAGLHEMWVHVAAVAPEVQDFGLDASLIQIAGANDVVVTAFFEVNLGNRLGAMSICTPYTVLEQVASKLSAQVWLAQGQRHGGDARMQRAVRTILGTAPLDITVQLGEADVLARSIVELREGDTLVLDGRVDGALSLLVGEHLRFLCRPGMVGNRVAVRISEVLEQVPFDAEDAASSSRAAAGAPLETPVQALVPANEEVTGAI